MPDPITYDWSRNEMIASAVGLWGSRVAGRLYGMTAGRAGEIAHKVRRRNLFGTGRQARLAYAALYLKKEWAIIEVANPTVRHRRPRGRIPMLPVRPGPMTHTAFMRRWGKTRDEHGNLLPHPWAEEEGID